MLNVAHSPLLQAITGHAAATPDKTALVAGDRRISYSQLVAAIEQAAAFLQSLGLKPGDHIILSAQKELEFVYLYFAAHQSGIINVVVDSAAPADRLAYIIDVVHPAVLFGDSTVADRVRCVPFSALATSHDMAAGLPAHSITPDAVADVMFTTGTTAAPKGVCLSHANIAASASNTNSFIGNGPDDVEALALPLSHSFGLGRLRCSLLAGATMVMVSNFANLKSLFSVMTAERVTGFGMVPAVWQYIKRLSGKRIGVFADQLRFIEIGSAALPVEDKRLLMELFPHTRLCMHYGLTEASRAMFSEFHTDAANLHTIGRPASAMVQAVVLDDSGHPVDDGMDGEICVKGNMVTRSYFLEKDNADAFYGDEWFRTGDWGHRDASGNFYLTGRRKELINVGGEKVSPATIEDAICSLGVSDCACVAVPDPNGVLGEVPKAFICRGGTTMGLDEIKQQLVQLLPNHEIPVLWEWIDSIPRTPSGKIQRLKLKS